MRLLVQDTLPIIDLDGYRRLRAVEREIVRSPAAVAWTLAAAVGLLLILIGGARLFDFAAVTGGDGDAGRAATVLVGALLCAAAVGLSRAWHLRRLARLRCPDCGGALGRHAADLGEAEQGRWGDKGVSLDGRRYSG